MRRGALSGAILAVVVTAAACGDGGTTVRQDDASAATTAPAAAPAYEVTATVLESPDHGPQLCLGGVAESYPPQCGGPDVVGWDWAAVDGAESAAGTTWGTYRVVGTWDGDRLTLTEPPGPPDAPVDGPATDFSPACDDPVAVDPGAGSFEGFDSAAVADLVALWVSDPAGDWDGPFTVSVVVRPGGAPAAEAAVRRVWAGALCVVERDQPTAAELAAVQEEVTGAAPGSPLGTVYVSYSDERRGVVVAQVAVADDAARAWAAERWGDRVELVGLLRPVG